MKKGSIGSIRKKITNILAPTSMDFISSCLTKSNRAIVVLDVSYLKRRIFEFHFFLFFVFLIRTINNFSKIQTRWLQELWINFRSFFSFRKFYTDQDFIVILFKVAISTALQILPYLLYRIKAKAFDRTDTSRLFYVQIEKLRLRSRNL